MSFEGYYQKICAKGHLTTCMDEKLAKELWEVFSRTKTGSLYDDKIRWLSVARHVRRLVLEGKIEIHKEYLGGLPIGMEDNYYAKNRIAELRSKLSSLTTKEGGKV